MQTCLWQALDKQTDGDWTGVTSNQLSDQVQIAFAAFCFFFFLGLHMRKMGQVSAHSVKVPGPPCLHSQHYLLALGARGATETSPHSWKVRDSWTQCQVSQFPCGVGYQTTMAQPQLACFDLCFLFHLLPLDALLQQGRGSGTPASLQQPASQFAQEAL